VAVDIINSVAL